MKNDCIKEMGIIRHFRGYMKLFIGLAKYMKSVEEYVKIIIR